MNFEVRPGLEPTSATDRLRGRFLALVTLGSPCLQAMTTLPPGVVCRFNKILH